MGDFAPASAGTAVLTSFAYQTSAIDPGPSDLGFEFVVACFAAGTRILTAAGEVPVELLRPGDRISGGARNSFAPCAGSAAPASIAATIHAPRSIWPVLVSTGAFGRGRPARPLRLSPDHAVHAGGALVPIRHLINDVTITQCPVDAIGELAR